MHKPGRQQAVGVDLADPGLACPGERRMVLQVGERGADRGVMSVADLPRP
jgi:hypothetical protein